MVKKINDNYSEFYKTTNSYEASPLLIYAESLLNNKFTALDIGCGAGRDTRYLIDRGYAVTAVDINPEISKYLDSIPHKDKLKIVISPIEEFGFEKYDLVSAQWSLPFVDPGKFDQTIHKIKESINKDGMFVGQLFGVNDEWNTLGKRMKFVTKNEVREIFKGMELIRIREEKREGVLPSGIKKRWHLFHVVARKI